MSQPNRKTVQFTSLALLLAGALFGAVLAGAIVLTSPTLARDAGPVRVASVVESPSGAGAGLPGFAELASAVEPAVVSVQASTIQDRPRGRNVDPFDFFFGPRDRRQMPDQENQEDGPGFRSDSGGSGFLVSADGLVVTNVHVVRDADEITVRLERREYRAEVVGTDPATDLALLKIDAGTDLPYLALGDSDSLRSGDWVMAVGDPLGLAKTVTVGVVSAMGRSIGLSQDPSFENFIQTDAAINFGNSGGPLINLRGEVIGINTAINYGAENIGFAVPVNTLKMILPQLRETGEVRRGYLGISIQDVDYEVAEAFGLDEARGVLVQQTFEGLPGAEAGLQPGDIILEVDGRRVDDTRGLIDYVSAQGPDAQVTLDVLRDGESLGLEVTLAERGGDSGETGEMETQPSESGLEWLGVRYQDLTPGARRNQGLPEDVDGVWITRVEPTSPLWDEGVRNDGVTNIITQVNGQDVTDVATFERLVNEAPDGSRLRLYLRRFANGEEGPPGFVFPRKP